MIHAIGLPDRKRSLVLLYYDHHICKKKYADQNIKMSDLGYYKSINIHTAASENAKHQVP
jgi:hypothetical protein